MREHTSGTKTMTSLITNITHGHYQVKLVVTFALYYILYIILYTLTELLKIGISLDLCQES